MENTTASPATPPKKKLSKGRRRQQRRERAAQREAAEREAAEREVKKQQQQKQQQQKQQQQKQKQQQQKEMHQFEDVIKNLLDIKKDCRYCRADTSDFHTFNGVERRRWCTNCVTHARRWCLDYCPDLHLICEGNPADCSCGRNSRQNANDSDDNGVRDDLLPEEKLLEELKEISTEDLPHIQDIINKRGKEILESWNLPKKVVPHILEDFLILEDLFYLRYLTADYFVEILEIGEDFAKNLAEDIQRRVELLHERVQVLLSESISRELALFDEECFVFTKGSSSFPNKYGDFLTFSECLEKGEAFCLYYFKCDGTRLEFQPYFARDLKRGEEWVKVCKVYTTIRIASGELEDASNNPDVVIYTHKKHVGNFFVPSVKSAYKR